MSVFHRFILISLLFSFFLPPVSAGEPPGNADGKEDVSEGSIRIVTDIPDLKVYFNGEAEGLAHPDRPLLRDFLPAGPMQVTGRTKGGDEKTERAIILSGQTAEVIFRFLSPSEGHSSEDNSPKAGISEEESAKEQKIAPPIRTTEELLLTGDRYFRLERYLLPKGENAFEMYRAVLMAEPENLRARKKIYEMTDIYRKLTADFQKRNLKRARTYSRNCLLLLRYSVESLKDTGLKEEYLQTEKQVRELEAHIQASGQLCKEADSHFIAQRYTTPEGKNAFELYKAALAEDPTNEYARKRIQEIAEFYKERGDKALQKGEKEKAESFYRQYLPIAEYVAENFGNRGWKRDTAHIRNWSDRVEKIRDLLSQAKEYTDKDQLTVPENENALHMYQQVLQSEKGNEQALSAVPELLRKAYAKAGTAFEQGRYEEVRNWAGQYLQISGYITRTKGISFPAAELRAESEDVRRLLKDADNHLRGSRLESLRSRMKADYEKYRELQEKEKADENVAEQIVPVMKEIMEDLNRIEEIYLEFPIRGSGDAEDMTEKINRIRTLREEMEQELAVRMGKTY